MLLALKYIIPKLLVILIILIAYYLIDRYYNNVNNFNVNSFNTIETFEEKIEKEKNNYLKLKETYIESEGTSLDLLYVNYAGEEINKDVWEDKTLDQCIDTCNTLDNCIGFNRDSVLDSEPANCYPRTKLQKCYSNRKGDNTQMSNAIKYNSYVKSTYPNIINTCIGDTNLTLNRIIVIKSYSMPNQYVGYNGDSRVSLIDKKISNLKKKCNFRIEPGKDGVGTVSFFHIDTNQYLYRNSNNKLIFKDISNNKTEDKQRASFNIVDGLSNGIMFKVMPIEGETTDKYIILNNTYLEISKLSDTTENLATFYIIDNIVESNIITDINKIPKIQKNIDKSQIDKSQIDKSQIDKSQIDKSQIDTSQIDKSQIDTSQIDTSQIIESFTNTVPVLDTSSELLNYNHLFEKNNNINISNYLEDTYSNATNDNILASINRKFNDKIMTNKLSNTPNNEDVYNSLNELNREIEKEIANRNLDLNAKNDKIISNLDRMRMTDLAKDYFFLKNISN